MTFANNTWAMNYDDYFADALAQLWDESRYRAIAANASRTLSSTATIIPHSLGIWNRPRQCVIPDLVVERGEEAVTASISLSD